LSGNEFKIPNLKSTIIALAEELREVLPELNGRIIPVSEMEVNRSNVPTLPIGMVALADIVPRHSEKTNRPPTMVEQIIVEFWFKSIKVTSSDRTKESPFWEFYDYEVILYKVTNFILQWTTPKGFKLKFTRMDLESTELAIHLSFTFFHEYEFCIAENEDEEPVRIVSSISAKLNCECQQIGV
jgi:hypothetical protein